MIVIIIVKIVIIIAAQYRLYEWRNEGALFSYPP